MIDKYDLIQTTFLCKTSNYAACMQITRSLLFWFFLVFLSTRLYVTRRNNEDLTVEENKV